MKTVFIQPYYHNIWEALGIGYVAAYCRNLEPNWPMSFFQGRFDSEEDMIKGSLDADIVAFSCTSPTFQNGYDIACKIKKVNPKAKIVFGGWHITTLPELDKYPVIDQIVIGEGEEGFGEILFGNHNRIVNGIKMQLQYIPTPDRELIRNERTIDLCYSMNGMRTASFQSSRGCPMQCAFCSEHKMTGKFNSSTNPIRKRDIVHLCTEIERVVRDYQLTYFKFVDATFDTSPSYVIDFCKAKIEYGIKTEWEAMLHANFITEEMLFWMKQANCNQVNIGCESGSNKILRAIGKGVNTDTIAEAFDIAKRIGLKRRAFFILGMPDETLADIELTEKFVERIRPDVVGFTILCPYPGCSLYDHEQFKNIDWSKTDEYANDFWKTKHFTNVELKAIQKRLVEKCSRYLCERQR